MTPISHLFHWVAFSMLTKFILIWFHRVPIVWCFVFSPSVGIVLSSFVVIMDWFSLMDQSEFFSCLFFLLILQWAVAINWLFIVYQYFQDLHIHLCGGGGVCCSAPNNDNDDFQFVQWKKCLFFLVFFHYSFFSGVLILTEREVVVLVIFVAAPSSFHRHLRLIIIQKDQSVLFIGKLVYIECFTLAWSASIFNRCFIHSTSSNSLTPK